MSAAEQYEALAGQLHALICAGQPTSPEADALRERMDPVWERLTEEEKDVLHLKWWDELHGGEGGA